MTEHDEQTSDGLRIGAEHFEDLPLVQVSKLTLGLENAPGTAPSTNIENLVCSGLSDHAAVSWSDLHSRVTHEWGKKDARDAASSDNV
jgi:hypothetical protein